MASKEYWLWQAKNTYRWAESLPNKRWEQFMYFYLFKWVGYEDD